MAKPTSTAVMFVIRTGRRRSTRISTSGSSTRGSNPTPKAASATPPRPNPPQKGARREPAPAGADPAGRPPPPFVRFAEAVERAGQRAREDRRAGPVDPRPQADLLARDVAVDGVGGRQRHQPEPEQQ